MSLSIPLTLKFGSLEHAKDMKQAINQALDLLLNTTCNSFIPDPEYGFVFNNLRFEIFNENEGVIYNSEPDPREDLSLYNKRITGSSKNINTFAADLKEAINTYEKRLSNVDVKMNYNKEERRIQILVKGNIIETMEEYQYNTYINIWH